MLEGRGAGGRGCWKEGVLEGGDAGGKGCWREGMLEGRGAGGETQIGRVGVIHIATMMWWDNKSCCNHSLPTIIVFSSIYHLEMMLTLDLSWGNFNHRN